MAETNFTLLTDEQKTVWARDVWKTARQHSFIMNASGTGINSSIQRITELTKDEKGSRAVITLVPDLEDDGVVGDYELEGNEEAAVAYDRVIHIDQLRHANKSKGRMAEQKTVVRFRETSKDLLGFWLGDRTDQLASLTLAGVTPILRTNGALRSGWAYDAADAPNAPTRNLVTTPVGKALVDMECFTDPDGTTGDRVVAPSSNRHFRWNGTTKELEAADVTAITAADTPSYAMLVEAKAFAKDRRLKVIRGGNGMELFHVLMHPKALAKLKLDADFQKAIITAGDRGSKNPFFSGAIVTVDGLVIHEFHHVFNTLGAATGATLAAASAAADAASDWAGAIGAKWGANADINGSAVLMLGSQALAYADISIPEWDERNHFDYGAKPGIAVAKICGFLKPQFYSPMDNFGDPNGREDFGVIRIDVAI